MQEVVEVLEATRARMREVAEISQVRPRKDAELSRLAIANASLARVNGAQKQ
jgi:hypothetical protein